MDPNKIQLIREYKQMNPKTPINFICKIFKISYYKYVKYIESYECCTTTSK